MKIDVRRVSDPKHDGNFVLDPNGIWWVWKEVCDRCGNTIFEDMQYLNGFPDGKTPDTSCEDLCLSCMRKELDERIANQS